MKTKLLSFFLLLTWYLSNDPLAGNSNYLAPKNFKLHPSIAFDNTEFQDHLSLLIDNSEKNGTESTISIDSNMTMIKHFRPGDRATGGRHMHAYGQPLVDIHNHPFTENGLFPYPSFGDIDYWNSNGTIFGGVMFGEEIFNIQGHYVAFFNVQKLPSRENYEKWVVNNPNASITDILVFFEDAFLGYFQVDQIENGKSLISKTPTSTSVIIEKIRQYSQIPKLKHKSITRKRVRMKQKKQYNYLSDIVRKKHRLDSENPRYKKAFQHLRRVLNKELNFIHSMIDTLKDGSWENQIAGSPYHSFENIQWSIQMETATVQGIIDLFFDLLLEMRLLERNNLGELIYHDELLKDFGLSLKETNNVFNILDRFDNIFMELIKVNAQSLLDQQTIEWSFTFDGDKIPIAASPLFDKSWEIFNSAA